LEGKTVFAYQNRLLPELKEILGNIKLSVGKLFSTYGSMMYLRSVFYFAFFS